MPAPPRSLVLQACSASRLSAGSGGLGRQRRPDPRRPALRGKFATRPGQPGRLTTARNPRPAGSVRAAARPSLRLLCLRASEPCGSRGCPAPGRLGRDLWGGRGDLPRPPSQPPAPLPANARGPRARGQGARGREQARSGLGGGSRPRRGPARPGGSPSAPGTQLETLGRAGPPNSRWKGQCPHGQGSKASPPLGRDPWPRTNVTG